MRQVLIDELMDLRLEWVWEDYEDAYADEWNEMPETLKGCHEAMGETIFHTYDDDLILQCINNES